MTRIPLAILLAVTALSAAANAQEPPKILVVDLQRVVETCDEAADMITALNREKLEKQKQLESEIQAIKKREEGLLQTKITERDPDWYEKIRQVQLQANEVKSAQAYFLALANDRIARKLNALMLGAQMEARKIMKQRGAELVLISKTGRIRLENDQQLKDELINRRVLCLADEADITDAVLERMNAWYEDNKTSEGEVPERAGDGDAEGGQ